MVLNKNNVCGLINAGIIPLLVDMALLAHLHTNRAKIHSQVYFVFFFCTFYLYIILFFRQI